MNQNRKLFLNTSIALIYKGISIISGLLLPRAILFAYGSSVNGLVDSITQFLAIISMLELGVSAVVQTNLYGPLTEHDYSSVSRIFSSSQKYFRRIAGFFLIYIAGLLFLYPFLVKGSFSFLYTAVLILIISITSFSQYYFGISYRIVLNADQYSYIVTSLQGVTLIINTIVSLMFISAGFSIHFVKLIASFIFLLQPFFLKLYVDSKYKIEHKIIYSGEPIKQKWNGLAQHIAFIVATRTDSLFLTIFSTLENVSIYAVYNLVMMAITSLFEALNLGITPLFGHMLVRNEHEKVKNYFNLYEWIFHLFTILLFTITGITVVPFISVYTKGITDANYIVPLFACIITLASAVRILRTPYNTIVIAAGHFRQTQGSAIIEATINVGVSILAVVRYGLVGVAVGTLLAMVYRTFYLAWYLSRYILYRDIMIFLKLIIIDIGSILLIYFTSRIIEVKVDTYFEWVALAAKVSVIGIIEILGINILLQKKNVLVSLKLIFLKSKILRKK